MKIFFQELTGEDVEEIVKRREGAKPPWIDEFISICQD